MVNISKTGRSHGFTLVELLIVITIIGILAGIGIGSYIGQLVKARDTRRKADLEQIRSALEMYWADCNIYPVGALASGSDITCSGKIYLKIPSGPSGDTYTYTRVGSGYQVCATLESPAGAYCLSNP